MATAPRLSAALKREYQYLYDTMDVTANAAGLRQFLDHCTGNRSRYVDVVNAAVADEDALPWWLIALAHWRESTGNWGKHLHNGDPLTARTESVPAGRPKSGTPPFSWEESAVDAVRHHGLTRRKSWDVPTVLRWLEGYNGWGYRLYHGPEEADGTLSPYLWAGSSHYTSGKYIADGKYSGTAVDKQLGCATLMRHLHLSGVITVNDLIATVQRGADATTIRAGALMRFGEKGEPARSLQTWLNQFPGVALRVDGNPGRNTSDAFRVVTGNYLAADPVA